MREQHEKVVIFSVEKADLTKAENTARNVEILSVLYFNKVPYKVLEGRWFDEKEVAFLIPEDRFFLEAPLFKKFDQDAYLLLDIDREAFLIYPDGRKESIGYFKEIDKTIALKKDAYTYDPTEKKYYICSGRPRAVTTVREAKPYDDKFAS